MVIDDFEVSSLLADVRLILRLERCGEEVAEAEVYRRFVERLYRVALVGSRGVRYECDDGATGLVQFYRPEGKEVA